MLRRSYRIAIAVLFASQTLVPHSLGQQQTRNSTITDAVLDGLTVSQIKSKQIPTSYDYVIVGGGAGGMLMAMRLTENPLIKVAVIEAGTVTSQLSFTFQPGQLATSNFVDTTAPFKGDIDWLDITLPIKANSEAQHYPQGKMIGGSTARGFSAYTRGTVGSYDKWATQVGDQAYTFANFEPYLQKSVKFTPPNIQLRGENTSDIKFDSASWSPTGGPMQVAFANYAAPFATWMKPAFEQTGAPSAADFANGTLNGVQYLNVNINPPDQHRSYAVDFLDECRTRQNLKVFTRTIATKVMFDGITAKGLMALDRENNTIPITAEREVIVSAGVIRSPQLLMISGVGPRTTLQQFGIPVVSALESVGQNLSDRPFVGTTYQVNMETTSQAFNKQKIDAFNVSYFSNPPTGIFTGTVDMTSFENVPAQFQGDLSHSTQAALAAMPQDWPVFQYLPVNGDLLLFRTTASKPPEPGAIVPNFGSIAAAVAAPQSRGSVTIRSNNFLDPAVLDIGYLNNEADIELLMVAFKRSRVAWKSQAAKGALIGDEYWPGYDLVPDDDDAKIREHVVQNVMPIWEATATCAMSNSRDTGVVDSNGRVFGTNNLRVVDASSLPFGPPGHPASSVLGMAELISERMKADFVERSLRNIISNNVQPQSKGVAKAEITLFPVFLLFLALFPWFLVC